MNHTKIISKFIFINSLLFLISLFFPLRKVFFSNSAYLTGAYSDFTSFSLYLSDILLFTTWFLILISRGGAREWAHHVVKNLKWLIFWLILGFLWHIKSTISLNWYFLLKYAELIVAYGTFVYLVKNFPIKAYTLKIFLIFGTWESFLAITQFLFQKSVGFSWLGENTLNTAIIGVAKIVSGGTTYIRGYGTFPHPNLLAAFLVTNLLICLYFYLKSQNNTKHIFACLFIFNSLGLTLTFSRAGFLALVLGIIILFFGYKHKYQIDLWKGIWLSILSLFLCFLLFRPFLISRTTISDSATLERKEYNLIGLKIIKQNPVFGVGVGESVLHMERYSDKTLEIWQKQPIHNYFLLSAAELGIPGALILIWIFLSHLKNVFIEFKHNLNAWHLTLSAIVVSFLVLMFFDHYFYTLEQTQLLLWTLLGIIAAETNQKKFNE